MVDGIAWAGVRSTKLDKMGFFSKLTMILPPLSLVSDHPPAFLGSQGVGPATGFQGHASEMAKPRHNSGIKS